MRKLLCLGDSNTYGYDPRSYFGSRYPKEVRWTGLLEQQGYRVFNCGQNGLTIPSPGAFPTLRGVVESRLPLDAVTVMLGSNDLGQGLSAREAAEKMAALLRFLRKTAPEAQLLLLAPPPVQLGEWVQTQRMIEESVRLGAQYRELAARLALPFADAGDWGVALGHDGVHFLPEGHAAFARGLGEALAALFAEKRCGETDSSF
ncbi:MAG: lipase [Oscillospiraceae bacterium]|nr:lipase [Oscillospiraceae bacterium]